MFGILIINVFDTWDCVVGGESTADNCQILQSRVNRFKSDKYQIDSDKLRGYSCDINFTGMVCMILCLPFFTLNLSLRLLLCIFPILGFRVSFIQHCSLQGNKLLVLSNLVTKNNYFYSKTLLTCS